MSDNEKRSQENSSDPEVVQIVDPDAGKTPEEKAEIVSVTWLHNC